MDSTTPAAGEGISMLALSDSRVISDCSALTVSPALTSTSMTRALPAEPMSGTRISWLLAGAGAAAGATVSLAAGWVAGAAGAASALGAAAGRGRSGGGSDGILGGGLGGRRCRCGLGLGGGGRLGGRRAGAGVVAFQLQQLVAFLEAVAQLDLQALPRAGLGRGNLHAGL